MIHDERLILGADRSFMTVRHVRLCGSNREIGKKLAEIASERHHLSRKNLECRDAAVCAARRDYFSRKYPILYDRAEGIADAMRIDISSNTHDVFGLPYNQQIPPMPHGCSMVFFPKTGSKDGNPYLTRNYDFPRASMAELIGIPIAASDSKTPVMSEPYLLELHPTDGGFASLCLTSFDLLSGVLEGINSAGVTVAVNGDEIALTTAETKSEDVGLYELESMRMLLDTCGTVQEAKQAMLDHQHYAILMPSHYLIADNSGNAFVYEHSEDGQHGHIIDCADSPCLLTNHPLHRFTSSRSFPNLDGIMETGTTSFLRYRILEESLSELAKPYLLHAMRSIADPAIVSRCIQHIPEPYRQVISAEPLLSRTLWQTFYDIRERTMSIRFYLTEKPATDGGFDEVFSEYLTFKIEELDTV
ncbi:linear amide C-N hydrolase [bacterium]|nr:linear amide C-N hydrolase [candidate division CSSED10-310 bacterium]